MVDQLENSDKNLLDHLYQHVLNLEGYRNVFDDPEKLEATADYLSSALLSFGLTVDEHQFKIDDVPFRNIIGTIEAKDYQPRELLLCAHYDSAPLSPGANDNASGVAGVLEVTRWLVEQAPTKKFMVAFFTLEEIHPKTELQIRNALASSGLVDDELQFLTYHSYALIGEFEKKQEEALKKGATIQASLAFAYEQVQNSATKKERAYLKKIIELNKNITRTNWVGESICIGSTRWLANYLRENSPPKAVINFEEIGFATTKKGLQSIPPGIDLTHCKSYKVDLQQELGNFLGIISEKNSQLLAQIMTSQCEQLVPPLPYVHFALPYNYQEIAGRALDFLRSDHAPFWREGIPAIAITDTFEFRYPFYHTNADTLEQLDFPFMGRVCQVARQAAKELLGKS